MAQGYKWNTTSSVLGPVLFVIYINDLPECVKSNVFLFADDTNVFREIKDDSDVSFIQSDLNELFKWSETWLLKFHPDKCKVCQCSVKISSV